MSGPIVKAVTQAIRIHMEEDWRAYLKPAPLRAAFYVDSLVDEALTTLFVRWSSLGTGSARRYTQFKTLLLEASSHAKPTP